MTSADRCPELVQGPQGILQYITDTKGPGTHSPLADGIPTETCSHRGEEKGRALGRSSHAQHPFLASPWFPGRRPSPILHTGHSTRRGEAVPARQQGHGEAGISTQVRLDTHVLSSAPLSHGKQNVYIWGNTSLHYRQISTAINSISTSTSQTLSPTPPRKPPGRRKHPK